MSFLDFLLASDTAGDLHGIADAHAADTTVGITWGLFDGDTLISVHGALYLAEYARHDEADASDRPVGAFAIRPVADYQAQVAA